MNCIKKYSDNSKRKLLIIDDDEATRILITEILVKTYLEIIEADTGYEALCLLKKYPKDLVLVLLDICLPDCDVWKLISKFKSENYLIPIVIISAMNPKELKEKSRNFDIDYYLPKPFDIEDLKHVVEFYLKQLITI